MRHPHLWKRWSKRQFRFCQAILQRHELRSLHSAVWCLWSSSPAQRHEILRWQYVTLYTCSLRPRLQPTGCRFLKIRLQRRQKSGPPICHLCRLLWFHQRHASRVYLAKDRQSVCRPIQRRSLRKPLLRRQWTQRQPWQYSLNRTHD